MSVEAMTWAYAQRGIVKHGPKFLLVTIANHADAYGICFPGRVLLAEECEWNPKTVSENISVLEEHGLLKRVQRRRENGSKTSDWIVLAPNALDRMAMRDAPAKEYPEAVAEVARAGFGGGEKSSGEESSGEVEAPGQVTFSGGPEPSVEPSGTSSRTTSSKKHAKSDDRPEIVRLCNQLADAVAADGTARPNPDQDRWRDACRLLLDKDLAGSEDLGMRVRRVEYVIRWVHETPGNFWAPNVLSMPKLRERWPQLVKAIRRDQQAGANLRGADAARAQRNAERIERIQRARGA